MSTVIFDIETEALPWEQLQHFYKPEPAPADWSDDMVKYGVMKDPAKRQAKYDEVRAKWQASVDGYEQAEQERKEQFIADAAKKPYLARILAIGYCKDNGETRIDHVDCADDEADVILRFWTFYKKQPDRRWVGFNCHGYDLPLLVYRSWALSIAVPESVFVNHGRYFNDRFIDLMQVWRCGNAAFASLDTLCRFYELGAKPDGIDGSMFARLWNAPETRAQAIEYLTNDLRMTASLAARLGIIETIETTVETTA